MKNINLKNNSGITLLTLVITIIVLIILATVATYSGIEAIENTKMTTFTAELKIMQTHVNELYDKWSNGGSVTVDGITYTGGKETTSNDEENKGIQDLGEKLDSSISIENNVINIMGSEKGDFKFYPNELLQKLGIEGTKQSFFVNIEKRIVISQYGLKYKGNKYYTLEQLPNGFYNVEFNDKNVGTPNIDVTGKSVYYGDTAENAKYRFTVNITQGLNNYINKGDLYYGKIENGSVKNWSKTTDNTFLVDREGTYKIYYKDAANNVSNEVEYEIEPKSTLIDGESFNKKMKELSGTSSPNVDTENANIINFKISTSKPNDSKLIDSNKVSTDDSKYPVYMWFDTDTIWLWSEENWMYMDPNSSSMYKDLTKIKNIDLYSLNTSNVTSMSNMFQNCQNLTNIDVSNFDTSSVTSMRAMFHNCSKLEELDVSSFNTSNVQNMWYMFAYCQNLSKIYVSEAFVTTALTNMPIGGDHTEDNKTNTHLFIECPKLVGGSGTNYNSSYTDATYAHIDEGTSNPGYFTRKE